MAGFVNGFRPDDPIYDPYKTTRNQVQASPFTLPATPAYRTFQAPTNRFGGISFRDQNSPVTGWQQYLANINSTQDIDDLGLGATENDQTMDSAWNRWMTMNQGSMSPNALNALRNNRTSINEAYAQARASQPQNGGRLTYAQYLGGVDTGNTGNALSPQQKFAPVTFRRIRVSGG